MERAADLEGGFLPAGPAWRVTRRRQRGRRRGDGGGQALDLLLNGGVARAQLRVTRIKQGQVLLQGEHLRVAVLAGERRRHRVGRRATPPIPVLRQLLRIALPGHHVAENPQAGDAGDVADHEHELQIHLHERLLHPLHTAAGQLDQRLPMAEIGAQGDDRVGGPKAAAHQPDEVEVAEPFTIQHIGFARRDVFEMARVDQHHRKSSRLQQLIEGDPIHARGFHRHRADAAGGEPVRQAVQPGRERRKPLHRVLVAIGRHRDIMLGCPAIDPRRIGMDAVQHRRRDTRLRTATAMVFHGCLLHTLPRASGEQGDGVLCNLSNGITGDGHRRVTSGTAATPRARLPNGLHRTNGDAASVPGCSCIVLPPPARSRPSF